MSEVRSVATVCSKVEGGGGDGIAWGCSPDNDSQRGKQRAARLATSATAHHHLILYHPRPAIRYRP